MAPHIMTWMPPQRFLSRIFCSAYISPTSLQIRIFPLIKIDTNSTFITEKDPSPLHQTPVHVQLRPIYAVWSVVSHQKWHFYRAVAVSVRTMDPEADSGFTYSMSMVAYRCPSNLISCAIGFPTKHSGYGMALARICHFQTTGPWRVISTSNHHKFVHNLINWAYMASIWHWNNRRLFTSLNIAKDFISQTTDNFGMVKKHSKSFEEKFYLGKMNSKSYFFNQILI